MSNYKAIEDRITDYETAIVETERFLKKAKVALRDMKKESYNHNRSLTATAKRASMDTTKALAELRK